MPPRPAPGPAQVHPLEHQAEIAGIHLHMARPTLRLQREVEGPALEPLVEQQIPRAVPDQQLDPVPSPVQEDEQMAVQRVLGG